MSEITDVRKEKRRTGGYIHSKKNISSSLTHRNKKGNICLVIRKKNKFVLILYGESVKVN